MGKKTTIIAFANQKGGCSKTATANEFAAILKKRGYRVLAVDIDPQSNLSEGINAQRNYGQLIGTGTNIPSIYEVLKGQATAKDAIQHFDRYDIIPSHINMAGVDQELSSTIAKECILRKKLEPIKSLYDYIIIDCPPAISLATINAFVACDDIIIPIIPDIAAVSGLTKLYDNIATLKEYYNEELNIAGIVYVRFDDRTNNSQTIDLIAKQIAQALDINIFNTRIRSTVYVSDARTERMTVEEYLTTYKKPRNKIIDDYIGLVDEYMATKGVN